MTNGQNSGAGSSPSEPGRSASESQSSQQRNAPSSAGGARSSAGSPGGGAKASNASGSSSSGSAKTSGAASGGQGGATAGSSAEQISAKAGEALSKVSEAAQAAGQQGRQAAVAMVADAGEKAKHLFNEQVGAGAELAQQFAGSVRMAADNLAGTSPLLANFARLAADKVDEFSDTVRGQSAEEFLATASDFARRRPAVVFTAAATCGFVLFRLLKVAPNPARYGSSSHRAGEWPLQPRGDEWQHDRQQQASAGRSGNAMSTSQSQRGNERGQQFHGV